MTMQLPDFSKLDLKSTGMDMEDDDDKLEKEWDEKMKRDMYSEDYNQHWWRWKTPIPLFSSGLREMRWDRDYSEELAMERTKKEEEAEQYLPQLQRLRDDISGEELVELRRIAPNKSFDGSESPKEDWDQLSMTRYRYADTLHARQRTRTRLEWFKKYRDWRMKENAEDLKWHEQHGAPKAALDEWAAKMREWENKFNERLGLEEREQ